MSLANFVCAYVLFQLGLYFYERKGITFFRRKHGSFILIDKPEEGLSNYISQFIEYGVLNRYSIFGYKNSVRSNNRLLASTLLTLFGFIASDVFINLFNISTEKTFRGNMALAFGAFYISSFILERQSLHKKWEFLYKQKQEYVLETDSEKKKYLYTSLLYNIVIQEMWSHRTFRDLVFEYITDHKDSGYSDGEIFIFDKRTILTLLKPTLDKYEKPK